MVLRNNWGLCIQNPKIRILKVFEYKTIRIPSKQIIKSKKCSMSKKTEHMKLTTLHPLCSSRVTSFHGIQRITHMEACMLEMCELTDLEQVNSQKYYPNLSFYFCFYLWRFQNCNIRVGPLCFLVGKSHMAEHDVGMIYDFQLIIGFYMHFFFTSVDKSVNLGNRK